MNRRGFISRLGGVAMAVAAAVYAPGCLKDNDWNDGVDFGTGTKGSFWFEVQIKPDMTESGTFDTMTSRYRVDGGEWTTETVKVQEGNFFRFSEAEGDRDSGEYTVAIDWLEAVGEKT